MTDNTYFVEATDDGVIITKYGREYNYNCPTGSTLSFECHGLGNALMLAKLILGGRKELRKDSFDMVIEVMRIYPYKKWTNEDDEEEGS